MPMFETPKAGLARRPRIYPFSQREMIAIYAQSRHSYLYVLLILPGFFIVNTGGNRISK